MKNTQPSFKSIYKVLFIFVVILFGCSQTLCAQPTSKITPLTLDQQVKSLLKSTIPNTSMGIMVMNADSGKILYQHNAYRHYTPASTTKLFTAAAALYYLKPDYRYPTSVFIDKKTPLHAEFPGNIYIKFSGDPSFQWKDLTALIEKIRNKGIKTIKGNIILDTDSFSGSPYPQGMTIRDTWWSYGAPVTSVVIDRNSVPIAIAPSKTIDHPVDIQVVGNYRNYFPLHSNVKTVTMPDAQNSCEISVLMSSKNRIDLQGCWPIDKPVTKKLAVNNPTHFAEQIIRKALKSEQIQLKGTIKTGTIPKYKHLLVQHLSRPLSVTLGHMLHFSDNLYANAFLKTLGTHYNVNKQGDYFSGVLMLKKILSQHTDINFENMVIFDGAGISAYNLITPYQLNQLLYAVYHSPQIKSTFINALPSPGENGTLSNRMHAFGLSSNVQAKTGSMTGTSTLAGFITAANHKNLIFTFMINNYAGPISNLRKFQDQLISIIKNINYLSS